MLQVSEMEGDEPRKHHILLCSSASGSYSFWSGWHLASPTAPLAWPVRHLPLAMWVTSSAPRLSSTAGSSNCCAALLLVPASSPRFSIDFEGFGPLD